MYEGWCPEGVDAALSKKFPDFLAAWRSVVFKLCLELPCPPQPPQLHHLPLSQSPHPPSRPPRQTANMSRRYDSRVRQPSQRHTTPPLTEAPDYHLLPRGTSLPGRICAGGYLARRNRTRHIGQGWHCACRREEGYQQTVGAGHISGEALHPQRVRPNRAPQHLYPNADYSPSAI